MQANTYLSTLRLANTLIKITTILTIMGVIAMKTGFLNNDSQKNKTEIAAQPHEFANK